MRDTLKKYSNHFKITTEESRGSHTLATLLQQKYAEDWKKSMEAVLVTLNPFQKKERKALWGHRRKLIVEEKWAEVDGWYLRPRSKFKGEYWEHDLNMRLAHKCANGQVRAPGPCFLRKGTGGMWVSGFCQGCKEKVSPKMQSLIFLESEDW